MKSAFLEKARMLNTLDENESSEPTVYFKKFTIAVFGDSGVGKSSIVRRLLVSDDYNAEHEPTVEEFYVKQMTHRNKAYELHIIDTSGTYEFPAMRRIAIEKADAIVLVYSLDKPYSFTKLERYMEKLRGVVRTETGKYLSSLCRTNQTCRTSLNQHFIIRTGLKLVPAFI